MEQNVQADLDAKMFNRPTPCFSVKGIAVYKGSVDIS